MEFIQKMSSHLFSILVDAIIIMDKMFYFVLVPRLAMSVGIWIMIFLHRLVTDVNFICWHLEILFKSYKLYGSTVNHIKTGNTFESHKLGGIVNFQNTAIIIGLVWQIAGSYLSHAGNNALNL